MTNIVPESWRDRAFRAGEQEASGQSTAEILPTHDAETTSSSKAQYRLGKLVKRVRHDRYVASLEQLPETTSPWGTGDPHGEKEARGLTKAWERSQLEPDATAFLRARPIDLSRVIQASEFVSAGRLFLGMEEFLATRCPCCGATDANRDVRGYVMNRVRRSTSTSPWFTRSPGSLSGCRSSTRWKTELASTPTWTFE